MLRLSAMGRSLSAPFAMKRWYVRFCDGEVLLICWCFADDSVAAEQVSCFLLQDYWRILKISQKFDIG